MNPDKISNATRELKKPIDWSDETHGECSPLWVRITDDDVYESAWKPDADEIAYLNQGGVVVVGVVGFQPALRLNVELTLEENVARIQQLERTNKLLLDALRGGNAINDNVMMLRWLASRLVEVHGENPNVDYIRAARERANLIERALAGDSN